MKKGFTLAEVLITLAILGVVAAVTLPNMVQDTKYQQLGVKLAKFASTLENAAPAYAVGLGGEIGSNDLNDFVKSAFLLKNSNSYFEISNNYSMGETELKDSTQVGFSSNVTNAIAYKAQTSVVGEPVLIVRYRPDKKLASSLGPLTNSPVSNTFFFVVTEKGFVYPMDGISGFPNTCLKKIYDEGYVVKASFYKQGKECYDQ